MTDVETQFHRRRDFVDVLAARPGGADEGDGEFGIWNLYQKSNPLRRVTRWRRS